MDPVAASGTYDTTSSSFFQNIEALVDGTNVAGSWSISNGYKTLEFTTTDACSQDPCGNIIYCLPGNANVTVDAHAASLDVTQVPQALAAGASFDGLVDAAANSLDGNDDGIAEGSDTDGSEDPDTNDDYTWAFDTTDNVNDDVPEILELSHGIGAGDQSTTDDVEVTFSIPMQSSTLNSDNIQLWPDPWYEFWFYIENENLTTGYAPLDSDTDAVLYTKAMINHPELVSSADGGYDYYPVITRGVKSSYQICMFPEVGPASGTTTGTCNVDDLHPYCCEGHRSATACTTGSGVELPDSSQ
jgi:hypothetical protein